VEVLYVDDGSRDRTLAVIKELAEQDHRVRYLSLSRNFGHQAALSAGLEHARGDIVITMDSDLQHPPAVIPSLLEKWRAGHDVVLTIRDEDPRLSHFKRWTSRWFYRVIEVLSDTPMRSGASDFRLLSRRAVDHLVQLRETHRFLRGLVQWLGFPSAEVHFRPDMRLAGASKFTARSMANFALDAILSFSRVPLRLAFILGFMAVLLGLGHSLYLFSQLAFSRSVDLSWSLLYVSMHLLGGGILCTLGIVGEYVGRIYEQIKARPLYVLKEKSPDNRTIERRGLSGAA
jgi:dolichol-phosphate mannosyltransferase